MRDGIDIPYELYERLAILLLFFEAPLVIGHWNLIGIVVRQWDIHDPLSCFLQGFPTPCSYAFVNSLGLLALQGEER